MILSLLIPLLLANVNPIKHLIVDISAHGFGHFAQVAAVLSELEQSPRVNQIKLTIRSKTPISLIKERVKLPFELIPYEQDHGMTMFDAIHADPESSMDWYRNFHHNYEERVQMATTELKKLDADLILSDVPYLSLSAASKLNVPSIALCSLNWADIFWSYCRKFPGASKIHSEILDAYSQSVLFLQPTPSMPMTSLSNTLKIPPIVSTGTCQAEVLRNSIGIPKDDTNIRFVLIGVGGFGVNQFNLVDWPKLPNVRWIFPDKILIESKPLLDRFDFIAQSEFDHCLKYVDLLASCDLVITKTGYGTQTEAVVNRVPAICISRHDWPEHPYISNWHNDNGEVQFIDIEQVGTPYFGDLVQSMLEKDPVFKSVDTSGASKAAQIIEEYLGILE